MSEIKNITVKYIQNFLKCPVQWYLYKKHHYNPFKDANIIKKIAIFYLVKIMSHNHRTIKILNHEINKFKSELKDIEQVKQWIHQMQYIFEKHEWDIKCVNLPFSIVLLGNLRIVGTIDIVKETPFGPDIILYDFNKKFDIDNFKYDPTYVIYIMALSEMFKQDINSINIYNFSEGKIIDISRDSLTMEDQIDVIHNVLKDIQKGNIFPKVSLHQCKDCKVRNECFHDYNSIYQEIKKIS